MDDAINFEDKPYAKWLEGVLRDLYGAHPNAIALQMRDEQGKTYTCYWQVSDDDRSIMIDAMRQDGLWNFIEVNRAAINAMLSEGDEDESITES